MTEQKTKLTIGIPVYNGEKFVRKRLDNILSQTFQNFEVIIYDNSNDTTPKICEEYALKDKRIQHIHEKKRSGWIQGWINVMKKAKYEYFVLTHIDDLWSSNFLEENLKELEENPSAVASIGVLERFGTPTNEFNPKQNNNISEKIYKKIQQKVFRRSFKPVFEAKGSFEKKAEKILRNTWYKHNVGLIRTSVLKKSIIEKDMFLWDWPIVLNFIKFGDLHIAKKSKILLYVGETTSRQGMFNLFKSQKMRINEYLFPASTYTFWCMKNIGLKFFLKNMDYFIWLNFIHVIGILLGIHRKIRN